MHRVLLVEDEEIIRKGIRHSVPWESCGCCVVGEAQNGEEGRERIEELKPDIVVTDINMPVMDGLKMIAETKCSYDYVAIILTGYSDFEYAKEAIRNGVSNYVLKPLNMEEMKETLERAVLESENIHFLRERNQKLQELKNITLLGETDSRGAQDAVVEQVLFYLQEHYKEKVTLAELEGEFHYSERYINQKFQKEMGTTVIEYLNRYRIQTALKLIQENSMALSEVGWECGIGDYKYFNHVFKKYIGCSAREYKNKIQ